MLKVENLHKTYRRHADTVHVLNGVDLTVDTGEFVGIVGASGSGKSTLLHLIGTLDVPDSGTIELNGTRIDKLSPRQRDRYRNDTFGYIFQFYHLLPELTTLENVLVPAMIGNTVWRWGRAKRQWRGRAQQMLERVGLGHRLQHKPRELSGGEMQRAAIARALVGKPQVLLADEPTGNLDAEAGAEIVRLLADLNREDGVTIIMVTHNLEIVPFTDRAVRIHGGRVEPWQAGESPFRLHPPAPKAAFG